MKLLKKIIAMITGVSLLAVTMNFPVFAQGNTTSAQSDFESLLNEYHITVRGASAEISAKELKGIMKTGSPSARIQEINMNTDAPVRLSAKELLELQYYNTEGEMRESFLSEARNSVIDVELVRGKTTWGIGSSFTPYEDPDAAAPRKTTNISSKKTGNLTIKNSFTGEASTASATLIGEFFKITEGNQWVVGADDAGYTPRYSSPLMLANENIYVAQQNVSGTGGYVGNEVSCWYSPTFINGSNTGTIDIYVYPASKFNKVKYTLN